MLNVVIVCLVDYLPSGLLFLLNRLSKNNKVFTLSNFFLLINRVFLN
ncbi:hypothetical protein PMAG_b0381 [Pseudoalteromonas mariniglutinosa NCIMB 1770]|nr:hypothetical protein [Pseudoalteromonas mariniglutinosa NCIMB 1770]